MSEPIRWDFDIANRYGTTIDGVVVCAEYDSDYGWSVFTPGYYVEVHDRSRDLAARAVVAAVRVMRGER